MHRASGFLGRILAGLLLALGGSVHPVGAQSAADPAVAIVEVLERSAREWNQGNLDGFLLPYLDSPETTYVGSAGLLRGKDAIREAYQRSYWKSGRPADELLFSALEVRPLGGEHALVTGRYTLVNQDGAHTAAGIFSLLFRRTPQGWRILHDHSS